MDDEKSLIEEVKQKFGADEAAKLEKFIQGMKGNGDATSSILNVALAHVQILKNRNNAGIKEIGHSPGRELHLRLPLEIQAKLASKEAARHVQAENGVVCTEKCKRGSACKTQCPYPTDMCRVSPFHPVARLEHSTRPYQNMVFVTSSWGQCICKGPMLTTDDEEILMALIVLSKPAKVDVVNAEAADSYHFKGHIKSLLKVLGLTDGQKNYIKIRESLEAMMQNIFKLILKKQGQTISEEAENIITYFKLDKTTKEVHVVINPFFYQKYIDGNVTWLCIEDRCKLKQPVAKAIYRFMMSHNSVKWCGDYKILASSINLKPGDDSKNRKLIRLAVAEMIEQGILHVSSGFIRRSTPEINLIRTLRKKEPQIA